MMQIKQSLILTCLMLLLTSHVHAEFYRWVDENGRVHYSDKLPADKARQAHDKLSSEGVSKKKIERDKTDAERTKEKAEAEKISAERKAKAAKEARQRAKDKILLDTFSSERDIVYTRDDRLTSIESLINLTKLNNSRLNERLTLDKQTQERLLKANKKVPKNILDSISSIEQQIEKNNNYIVSQQASYDKIEAEFANDLERYKELKGLNDEATDQ